jgi:hypothetical protein
MGALRALLLTVSLSLLTPLAHAAPKTLLVGDYGAKGDAATLDSAAIQKTLAIKDNSAVEIADPTNVTGLPTPSTPSDSTGP